MYAWYQWLESSPVAYRNYLFHCYSQNISLLKRSPNFYSIFAAVSRIDSSLINVGRLLETHVWSSCRWHRTSADRRSVDATSVTMSDNQPPGRHHPVAARRRVGRADQHIRPLHITHNVFIYSSAVPFQTALLNLRSLVNIKVIGLISRSQSQNSDSAQVCATLRRSLIY